jgi:transposase
MSRDSCDVCRNPNRRRVDLHLARGHSTAYIARRIGVSRRRVVKHRDVCLEGDPLRVVAEELGYKLQKEQDREHELEEAS